MATGIDDGWGAEALHRRGRVWHGSKWAAQVGKLSFFIVEEEVATAHGRMG